MERHEYESRQRLLELQSKLEDQLSQAKVAIEEEKLRLEGQHKNEVLESEKKINEIKELMQQESLSRKQLQQVKSNLERHLELQTKEKARLEITISSSEKQLIEIRKLLDEEIQKKEQAEQELHEIREVINDLVNCEPVNQETDPNSTSNNQVTVTISNNHKYQLNNLRQRFTETVNKYLDLKKSYQSQLQSYQQLQEAKEKVEASLSETQLLLEQASDNLKEKNIEVKLLKEQLENIKFLHDQELSVRTEAQKINEQLKNLIEQLEASKITIENEKSQNCTQYENLNSKLQDEVNSLKIALNQESELKQQLEIQLKQLMEQIVFTTEEINRLTEKKKNDEETIQLQSLLQSELEHARNKLLHDLKQLQEAKNFYEHQLKEETIVRANLENENNFLQNELTKANEIIDKESEEKMSKIEENNLLEKQLLGIQEETIKVTESQKQLEGKVNRLEVELSQSSNQIKELNGEIESDKDKASKNANEIAELLKTREHLEQQIAELSNALDIQKNETDSQLEISNNTLEQERREKRSIIKNKVTIRTTIS